MADLNKVMLIGNLTRDPEVRYTPKGTAVGDLSIALNSSYKTQDGQMKDEVCYVDIVAWDRQAEVCKEYLQKGAPIFVEGRLQLDQWETKEGEKRSRLRVRAERIQFLGRGKGAEGGAPAGSSSSPGSSSGSGSGSAPASSRRGEGGGYSSSGPSSSNRGSAPSGHSEEFHDTPSDDDVPF